MIQRQMNIMTDIINGFYQKKKNNKLSIVKEYNKNWNQWINIANTALDLFDKITRHILNPPEILQAEAIWLENVK
jgi:hypothetical protein